MGKKPDMKAGLTEDGYKRGPLDGILFPIDMIEPWDAPKPTHDVVAAHPLDCGRLSWGIRLYWMGCPVPPPPLNEAVLRDLVPRYREQGYGDVIEVYLDGVNYFLGNGRHRVEAIRRAGIKSIELYVNQGTSSDAKAAWARNPPWHRQPKRSYRRYAVALLVTDDVHGQLSDSEIARMAGVDHKTVGKIRREILGDSPAERTVRRNGQTYTMKIPARTPKVEAPKVEPVVEAQVTSLSRSYVPVHSRLGDLSGVAPAVLHRLEDAIDRVDLNDPAYLSNCPARENIRPSLRHIFDGHVYDYRIVTEIIAPLIPEDATLKREFSTWLDHWSTFHPPEGWEACDKCSDGEYSTGLIEGDSQDGLVKCPDCFGIGFRAMEDDPDFVHPSLAPRLADMPRMPTRKEINAIRAQIGEDLLAKLDEEIEGFEDVLKDMKAIEKAWTRGRVGDHSDTWRLARCYIADGGPSTITPCPDCKDETGRSRGHDNSHPLWPKMCRRCHWYGYTGFGIRDESNDPRPHDWRTLPCPAG